MGDANDAFMRSQNAAVQARTKAQNRATVLQLKLIGQSHPTGLTPNLLKLFEPRPPLEFKPPIEKRKCPTLTGIAQYVSDFAEPNHPDYAPPVPECETPAQKKARIHKARLEKGAIKATEELEKYDPAKDPNATGDPYKTLFVARLNYETSEHRLKREFEAYGPIKRIRLVTDKERKPRGYAFIEFVHTRDMKTAYKQADGRKIDNRRVLVDVERGRTVANWRPRRLGGGLGSTRIGGEDANQKHSGRESQQPAAVARRSEEPRSLRSEEPRERHVDREREKSRDRGRDREREISRERSHDRVRDRDTREERHHRDRDRRDRERGKDRGHERERERGRGRDRERDRVRDPREYDHERDREQGRERDRRRERDRDQERDHGRTNHDDDHSRSYSKGRDYESNHGQDWHAGADSQRGNNYDGYGYPDEAQPHDSNSLEQGEFKEYDQMEADGGKGQYYDHPEAHDSHGKERGFGMEYDYQQKDRSIEQDVEQ